VDAGSPPERDVLPCRRDDAQWNKVPRARVHDPAHHHAGIAIMSLLISVLITFVIVILVLYLVNMLPIDGRAKQIVRVIVIIIGILSLLKYVAVF
jgi:hypothetical protein